MFAYCTIPQLIYYYDALILGSITIAYIIMTMHDIVFSINIAGGDVGVQCVFAVFTNPPLAGAASLSFQYWRIGNVIGGSFLLVINSMTLYSIWNMIYNLPANISQVGHMWPHAATSVFNMATSGNIIQVVRHLNAM